MLYDLLEDSAPTVGILSELIFKQLFLLASQVKTCSFASPTVQFYDVPFKQCRNLGCAFLTGWPFGSRWRHDKLPLLRSQGPKMEGRVQSGRS